MERENLRGHGMEIRWALYLAGGILCAILLWRIVRYHFEWLLTLVMRAVLGVIAIYFMNGALESFGIASFVGINPLTALTSAILGFPGFLAMYGLSFYRGL